MHAHLREHAHIRVYARIRVHAHILTWAHGKPVRKVNVPTCNGMVPQICRGSTYLRVINDFSRFVGRRTNDTHTHTQTQGKGKHNTQHNTRCKTADLMDRARQVKLGRQLRVVSQAFDELDLRDLAVAI